MNNHYKKIFISFLVIFSLIGSILSFVYINEVVAKVLIGIVLILICISLIRDLYNIWEIEVREQRELREDRDTF